MNRARLATLAITLLGSVAAADAHAQAGEARSAPATAGAATTASGQTVTFPYKQKELLYSRNGAGGLAYLPAGAGSSAAPGRAVPVVVFLHGMNPDAIVHMWFGPPYGDLRPIADAIVADGAAPFVLAAPTHTRFATGATSMWHDFDLADFLDTTERALGAAGTATQLDRSRVVVVGHSGAGCNPTGGILGESVAAARPLAVLAIDTCADDKTSPALAALAARVPLRFYWQKTWSRPIEQLTQACPRCSVEELVGLGATGHERILPEVLRRALPELLASPSGH